MCVFLVRIERDARPAQRVRGRRQHQVHADPHHGPLVPESGQPLPQSHRVHW